MRTAPGPQLSRAQDCKPGQIDSSAEFLPKNHPPTSSLGTVPADRGAGVHQPIPTGPLPNTNRKRDWELLFTGAREGATVNGPFTGHTLPAQSRLRLWCTGAGCGKTGRGLRVETPVNRTRLSAGQSRLGPPAGAASPPAFRPALWQMKFIGPNSI